MRYTFQQGWPDSLCGIYSIINAEKIINNSTEEESQNLFNQIVEYLAKKRVLKNAMLNGIGHRRVVDILNDVVGDRIPFKITNRKNILTVSCWWEYTHEHMSSENRATIVSIGGREDHFTVIKSMSEKIMTLSDSGGYKIIRKTACKLKGYEKKNKFVIFPAQCIYLGKD